MTDKDYIQILGPDWPDEYGNDGEFGDTPTHWTALPEPPERM